MSPVHERVVSLSFDFSHATFLDYESSFCSVGVSGHKVRLGLLEKGRVACAMLNFKSTASPDMRACCVCDGIKYEMLRIAVFNIYTIFERL